MRSETWHLTLPTLEACQPTSLKKCRPLRQELRIDKHRAHDAPADGRVSVPLQDDGHIGPKHREKVSAMDLHADQLGAAHRPVPRGEYMRLHCLDVDV